MTATVLSSTLVGADSIPVSIESDMSNSLPGISIVGLGAKSVDESKERIRSAIKNSKLSNPKKRIIINLSPADVPKSGAHFDLGMTLSILLMSGQIPPNCLDKTLVIGELGLNGDLKPAHGIIGHIKQAQKAGCTKAIIPIQNLSEASLIDDIMIIPARSLSELYQHLTNTIPIQNPGVEDGIDSTLPAVDMAEIQGQNLAKRALEIAAAGGHNILMSGPPGGGKTMLAKALSGILPPLNRDEVVETTHIHSVVNFNNGIVKQPPFRSPHHSASSISLVGGGQKPVPGEISLAHNGVLFLDEMPEFSRQSLEALRQPLEDGIITISRISSSVTFPANCMLVATRNPCPCGYYGDSLKECVCTQTSIDAYQKKLSGPLIDRIDMSSPIERVSHNKLLSTDTSSETSAVIQKRVIGAKNLQLGRQGSLNAKLSSKELKKQANLTESASKTLLQAAHQLNLSSRGYIRTLKVSRTIADLSQSITIDENHILEALQYRHEYK